MPIKNCSLLLIAIINLIIFHFPSSSKAISTIDLYSAILNFQQGPSPKNDWLQIQHSFDAIDAKLCAQVIVSNSINNTIISSASFTGLLQRDGQKNDNNISYSDYKYLNLSYDFKLSEQESLQIAKMNIPLRPDINRVWSPSVLSSAKISQQSKKFFEKLIESSVPMASGTAPQEWILEYSENKINQIQKEKEHLNQLDLLEKSILLVDISRSLRVFIQNSHKSSVNFKFLLAPEVTEGDIYELLLNLKP